MNENFFAVFIKKIILFGKYSKSDFKEMSKKKKKEIIPLEPNLCRVHLRGYLESSL